MRGSRTIRRPRGWQIEDRELHESEKISMWSVALFLNAINWITSNSPKVDNTNLLCPFYAGMFKKKHFTLYDFIC